MEPLQDDDYDEDEEPEIDFDFDDTAVQVCDGVSIGIDDRQIRLLFYYIKPGEDPDLEENTQCKAIIELRITQKKFLKMAKEFEDKAKGLERYHKKLTDYMFG